MFSFSTVWSGCTKKKDHLFIVNRNITMQCREIVLVLKKEQTVILLGILETWLLLWNDTCGDTQLGYVLLDSLSWAIQSHQDFSITIRKAVSGTCGVAATHRLLRAVVMTACMSEPWWNPARAATQSVSHPSSSTSLYALSSSGFCHSYSFSSLELLSFHPSYAVTWRNLLCCYQIENKARILDHSLDDPPGIAVGSDWKMRQNLNTNKMFPRWASWIWRHITHNTAYNLFKHLHLLIRAREQLHEMLLKVKITLVPCLGVQCAVQVHTAHRIKPTACH